MSPFSGMTAPRRWVILAHRWLGIVLGPLFLMWFISGIGMIFARDMPQLTPAMRLERMTAIDFSRVAVTPAAAATRAASLSGNGRVNLLMLMGRPAYRIVGVGGTLLVFADSGKLLEEIGDRESFEIARRFAASPDAALRQTAVLDRADQWTIGVRGLMPLHKFALADAARTELYVSEPAGEVVLMTTRASRDLAWIAAIPHWMYFRALRANDRLWTGIVLWASGVGTVFTVLGLVLAFTQRRTKYVGLMRWHYVAGVLFGVFALTWVFSGWLSMDPIDWAGEGSVGDQIPDTLSGPVGLDRFPVFDADSWRRALHNQAAKEVELRGIMDEPYYVIRGIGSRPILLSATSLEDRRQPFPVETILERVARAAADVRMTAVDVLADYDAYYYDRDRSEPLPVVRVKFADAPATWVYIDPTMGEVVARFTRGQRVERWLYHGLHSLDFAFWYYHPVAWPTGLIVLLIGGSTLSAIGMVMGIKRLVRSLQRPSASGRLAS